MQWCEFLKEEFDKPYFHRIIASYKEAIASNKSIFPRRDQIFQAFNLTPIDSVRAVILGQDPYHGSAIIGGQEVPQAMGLSFSVPKGIAIPPSLLNIYKELQNSLGLRPPNHGDLSAWARRGVLLLNAILTVEKGRPGSHKDFGWEEFSDAVISRISQSKSGIVFMLWGAFAKKKAALIDSKKHIVVTAAHPSPLARGFVGSGIFKAANDALMRAGQAPLDWSLA